MSTTRRSFLTQSGKAIAATAMTASFPLFLSGKKYSPNDSISIGLIGCRGMGFYNLENHLRQDNVICGGLCDVDQEILGKRTRDVEKITGKKPKQFKDFRRMLDDQEIDAVIIGTPDHWHCLMMSMACRSGKDVYVEKPMANSIRECELMVRIARETGQVVQVGQQQRSGKHWQKVARLVQNDRLGKIRRVRVWGNFNYGAGKPKVADSAPPNGLDYEMWLGPAARQAYNINRHHGIWRMQWPYGGGLLTDWGVHLIDIVLWAMNVQGAPQSVVASGGIFHYPDHEIQTPDTLSVNWQFDDWLMSWEHVAGVEQGPYNRHYGIAFIGQKGSLIVNRDGFELVPMSIDGKAQTEAIPFQKGITSNHERHAKNFLKAMRDRQDPICTVEMGYLAAFYAHMGNIAHRSQSRLVWNNEKGDFGKNKAANRLISPSYRKPWQLPV
ncbi:MAG: Gfo/Idh/MocA family oxidoreductase [Bacteroidota bacterium]